MKETELPELPPELAETYTSGETIRPPEEELHDTFSAFMELSSRDIALPALSLSISGDDKGAEEAEFQVLSTLGQGGMGVVHLAEQRTLGRQVAIKSPRPDRSGAVGDELLREARVVGCLEHPNIIPVYSLGAQEDRRPAMVMKRVEGVVWRELLTQPSHPFWHDVQAEPLLVHLDVLRHVCRAVEFAHSRGYLHRDLKADNVMVGNFGEVYLLDWGIAWPLNGPPTQSLAGTPEFIAPEMVGNKVLTEQSDVYLLGALLHELLTGKPRHKGSTLNEVIYQSIRSEPIEFGPDIPEELGAISNKATMRDPADRYPSARAFREAIEDFIVHRNSTTLLRTGREKMALLTEVLAQRESDDAHRLYTRELFVEGHFALQSALQIWPENQGAISARTELLRDMLAYELREGHLLQARHLYQQLPEADEALQAQLDDLAQAQALESARVRKLQAEADDLDLGKFVEIRIVGASLIIIALICFPFFGEDLILNAPKQQVYLYGTLTIGFMTMLIGIPWCYIHYHKITHKRTRQLLSAFLCMSVFALFTRLICWHLDLPVQAATLLESLVVGAGLCMLGTLLHPLAMLSSLGVLIGIIGALLYPTHWLYAHLIGYGITGLIVIWVELQWKKLFAQEEPEV